MAAEHGWSGIQIFFIISGFIIPYSMFSKGYTYKNWHIFLWKRILRIEPPYIISIVLVVTLNLLSSVTPGFSGPPYVLDFKNILGHIGYLNAFTGEKWLNDVYWTLAVEFEYYLLVALIFPFLSSNKNIHRWLVLLIFNLSIWLPFDHSHHLISFAPFFIAGIVLFQWRCGIISTLEYVVIIMLIIVQFLLMGAEFFVIIVLASLLFLSFVQSLPRAIMWLGLISYSLYLIHIPLGGKFINILNRIIVPKSDLSKEVIIATSMLFCFAGAWLFYLLFEKPFKSRASSIKYT